MTCMTGPNEDQIIQMPLLWEDDRHFIHYRCLVMNAAINRMEGILEMLDTSYQCELLDQLCLLKINLGQPTSMPTKNCAKIK